MNNIIEILENWADDIFEDNEGADRQFSDDGAIHIVRNGRRFVGGLGQGVSRGAWSIDARRIGRAIGLSESEIQELINGEFGE